jgi:hypothetical protein
MPIKAEKKFGVAKRRIVQSKTGLIWAQPPSEIATQHSKRYHNVLHFTSSTGTRPSRCFALSKLIRPQEIPKDISSDDRKRLAVANRLDMEPRVALYHEMIDRYSDSHPFLLVKLADLFVLLKAGALAIALYRKVRRCGCRLSTSTNLA